MRPVGAALGRRLELGDGKTTRAGADGEPGEHRRVVSRGGKGIPRVCSGIFWTTSPLALLLLHPSDLTEATI